MSNAEFDRLLAAMPRIADAIKVFESPEVQKAALQALVDAALADRRQAAGPPPVGVERDALIQTLNARHIAEHGRPISADKLVEQVRAAGHGISKTTALAILAELNGRPKSVE